MKHRSVLPWHYSLEQWCAAHYGNQRLRLSTYAPMAPMETYRPLLHREVPVVVVVLTAATRPLHRPLAEALELIRVATNAFRPVLVSDAADSPAVRLLQWPVEQVTHEGAWYRGMEKNWLELAAAHVDDVQTRYSAQYVLAPETVEQALDAVNLLALGFDAPGPVHQSARERITSAGIEEPLRTGVRGQWSDIPAGHDQRVVRLESGGAAVPVTTFRDHDGEAVLLALESTDEQRLIDWASLAGCNAAVLKADALLEVQADLPGEPQQLTSTARELMTLVNAAADALGADGAAIAWSVGIDQQAHEDSAAQALLSGCERIDGHLAQLNDAQLQITVPGAGAISFPEPSLPRVLAQLTSTMKSPLGL